MSDHLFSDPQSESHGNKSDLVIAFVAAVGVNLQPAELVVEEKLTEFGYSVEKVRVTKDVLPLLDPKASGSFSNGFERISKMMEIGTLSRNKFGKNIVALGIAAKIAELRRSKMNPDTPTAYLVHSLKHPSEVQTLRELYPRGFYLIGIHAPPESRKNYLIHSLNMSPESAEKLMDRDRKENADFGQKLVETFHLSDFFAGLEEVNDPEEKRKNLARLKNSLIRFLEIVFGHPNRTPTFGEYAMFLAFSAALRSADLSRQVGAVVTREREIVATGANDCPRFGGGLYWPTLNPETFRFEDEPDGRDWTRQLDSNRNEQWKLMQKILKEAREEFNAVLEEQAINAASEEELPDSLCESLINKLDAVLERSGIRDLTEFGRVVHAEMEAMLSCARNGVSTVGASLYSTTFPCHNCAKHIIAAGIRKVIFIEPYLKSRAIDLHDDAIEISYPSCETEEQRKAQVKVSFEPFFGVGPRRFFDLFSMDIGAGYPMIRKEKGSGRATQWSPESASPRVQMDSDSYLELEENAAQTFAQTVNPAGDGK